VVAQDMSKMAIMSNMIIFIVYCLLHGNFQRTSKTMGGWGKSSLQEDLIHVLMALVEGLDDQLMWPDEIIDLNCSNT
jgi:hypothetical protein